MERYAEKRLISFFALVLGTAVCYAFGTLWLSYQSGLDLRAALFAGVIPFIPVDLVKIVLVTGFGPRVRKRLLQAGLTAEITADEKIGWERSEIAEGGRRVSGACFFRLLSKENQWTSSRKYDTLQRTSLQES